VTVQAGQVAKDVLIRVGPKAARVAGRVVDAETGRAITNVSLGFYDAEGSLEFLSRGPDTKGEFSILVPFDKRFRFRASAAGYERWYYGTDGSEEHQAPMRLAQNQTKELVIKLRPLKNSTN
jgi:hypothetical protein